MNRPSVGAQGSQREQGWLLEAAQAGAGLEAQEETAKQPEPGSASGYREKLQKER